MVVVHSVGPRIAWFGARENLLYWDDAGEHRAGEWRLYGGHRLWVTRPGADESAEVQAPDNEPCRVERLPDGVVLTAPPTVGGIVKSLAIQRVDRDWQLTHRISNVGNLLWSGGAWALTCTLPRESTVYRIPLRGGPSTWDVTTIVIPTAWGGSHTSRLDDPQFTFTADAMELRARSDEGKRMLLAPKGVLEMTDERGLFRKVTLFDQTATYPLDTNVAVYVGPQRFMVELETMGPLRTLAPGHSLEHVEKWSLEAF